MRKIPFSPPDITEAEISAVCEVMRSGWITTGPKTKEFEQKLAEYCNTNKFACLNSATAAAECVLRLVGIGEGDEVIVPAYTYTASASVVYHVGAKIVMCDCAPGSFEMDYERLPSLITERTKAIIPVDIGGKMCDYDRLFAIAEQEKAKFHPSNEIQSGFGRIMIIADAAHSLGAEYHGKRSGSVADFSTFSFHAVKNLTTAEGGAATWVSRDFIDDDKLYKQFMLESLHGQDKDALAKSSDGGWEYDIVAPLYKCNMTDITAAIGVAQLDRYDGMLAARREMIGIYDSAFSGPNFSHIEHYGADFSSSGHLYLLRIAGIDSSRRTDFIRRMAESGVSCNVHYKPLPMMTAYKNLGFDINDFPNAYAQFVNEITLPLNTKMTPDDAIYVSKLSLDAAHRCCQRTAQG